MFLEVREENLRQKFRKIFILLEIHVYSPNPGIIAKNSFQVDNKFPRQYPC